MGLDNGIVFENRQRIRKYPFYVKRPMPDVNADEICYWRKCWGIRSGILGVLNGADYPPETVYYEVKPEHIDSIIKVIKYFDNKRHWNEENHSIWDYRKDRQHFILRRQVINLKWLKKYMTEHPEDKVVFYDSY